MINGNVIGLDILSLAPAYGVLHPKLVKSYAMDALFQEREKGDNGSVEKAKPLSRKPCNAKRKSSNPSAMGGITGSKGRGSWVLLLFTRRR